MSLASRMARLLSGGQDNDTAPLLPRGSLVPFALPTLPSGFAWCDGSALTTSSPYTALRVALVAAGNPYGVSGSDPLLPDLRERIPLGRGTMNGSANPGRIKVTVSGTKASTANGIVTVPSTTGLTVGMAAAGTGIGTNAVINTIDSATQVTLSVNNTATGTANVTFAILDTDTLGAIGGSATHTLQTGQMPAHTHDGNGSTNRNTVSGGSDQVVMRNGTANAISPAVTSAGGGQAHPQVPPVLVCNWIIKT